MFCWPSLLRCQVPTRSSSLNQAESGSSSCLTGLFELLPQLLCSTPKAFVSSGCCLLPGWFFFAICSTNCRWSREAYNAFGYFSWHNIGAIWALRRYGAAIIFFSLKIRVMGTFIADYKVPRRWCDYFCRLLVKQYSYLCSWMSSFWGPKPPLVSEELM